jgi:hypothetical protein
MNKLYFCDVAGQSNKKKPGGGKARLFGTFALREIQ